MGRITFTEIEAKSVLTKQGAGVIPNAKFSLNPYAGCAFGCSYCYVRKMQWGDDADEKSKEWGNWVNIKINALALLQKSRRRLFGSSIWLGSASDPYQPIERRLELTRSLLEYLAMCYPAHLHIQTRSPLVTRDLDIFERFGEAISVGVSIPTDDDAVRKIFEPSAPSIPQRFKAMEAVHQAGISVSASIAPILPCDPVRLGHLIKGRAESFWLDAMRYNWTNDEMNRRYRENGWMKWKNPDIEKLRAQVERGWNSEGILSLDSLNRPPSEAHNDINADPPRINYEPEESLHSFADDANRPDPIPAFYG